jgi:hypothetical protein
VVDAVFKRGCRTVFSRGGCRAVFHQWLKTVSSDGWTQFQAVAGDGFQVFTADGRGFGDQVQTIAGQKLGRLDVLCSERFLKPLFKQKVPHSYSSADESALSYTEFGMTNDVGRVNARSLNGRRDDVFKFCFAEC